MELMGQRHRRQSREGKRRGRWETTEFQIRGKNAAGKFVAAGHRNQHARRTRSPDAENRFIIRVHPWLRLLRWALNEGTLRAFRYADRFATFKIVSPAGRSSTTCRSRSIAAIGPDWLA